MIDNANFVALEGGLVSVGTDRPVIAADGEGPSRRVRLRGFRIGKFAVTRAEFAAFVEATNYVTDAERYGWSYVFHLLAPQDHALSRPVEAPWWRIVEGACWRHPQGPAAGAEPQPDHPATHISWNDASAYAAWASGRLPSEAEWEYAARGGLENATFPWGEQEPDDETVKCNIWQGEFPHRNSLRDGFLATAPVDSFEANGFGLYNMAGNVWEWCGDRFRVRSMARAATARNRRAQAENERVVKGGSYLCHKSYCYRYRIAARSGRSPDTSAGNTGFRIVLDI